MKISTKAIKLPVSTGLRSLAALCGPDKAAPLLLIRPLLSS